jgi:hypothetical protein
LYGDAMAKTDQNEILARLASGADLSVPLDQIPADHLAEEAVTNQAAYDQLIATNVAAAPMAVTNRLTDWNGLTPAQERDREQERQRRKHQEQEIAEAEYEQVMEEVRRHADLLMAELDKQRRGCLEKLADADSRAIVLPDGRHVLVGENGEYIEASTGTALVGADKAAAQRLQKPDSETVAERKKLTDWLIQIDDAEERVRKAEALAGKGPKDLSPEEMKQRETEARGELDKAEAISNAVADKEAHIEDGPGTASGLGDTDTLAALELDDRTNTRTASFAASLDIKENRPAGLQNQFTGAAVIGNDAPSVTDKSAPVSSPARADAPKLEFQK